MIYPKPKYINLTGEKIDLSCYKLITSEELVQFGNIICNGMENGMEKCIPVVKKPIEDFCRDCISTPKGLNKESYGIYASKDKITLYASTNRACYYGALALREIAGNGAINEGFLLDYPSMELRGIIEGFYGKPWTWEERHEVVEHISRHRMNSYIYAPKDDTFHREKWFEYYDAESIENIKSLFSKCKAKYIDFYYTISPGMSMEYSNEEHLELLASKIHQLYSIGIRSFGILFDDIPKTLLNEKDIQRFKDEVDAHIYITNMLYKHLKAIDSECSLIVCPTIYHGNGDEEYIVRLCRGIPDDVDVFWTGREICSHAITTMDAKYFYDNTGHKPLYWDNYPVNDAGMINEMHLGAICNRSKDLYRYSKGIVSNVMEFKESSMIPITTVCHYLWNPEGYNEKRSLEMATREVAGEEVYKDFEQYIKYCSKSCLNIDGNEEYINTMTKLRYAMMKGDVLQAVRELEDYFKWNICCGENLSKMDNKKLLKENRKWILKWMEFMKFNLEVIMVIKKKYTSRRINGIDKLKLFWMYKKLDNNPIDIMKFETRVLFDSLKSER